MKKVFIRNTIGWHVTDESFHREFEEALDSGEAIQIMINSPGGSVYMGWSIFNEIRSAIKDGADVTTYNIGLAASMGAFVLLAADKGKRQAAENSMTMIHNPSGMAFGEKDKMRKEEELLGKIEDLMSAYIAKVTGSHQDYIRALMGETTWMKPNEAKSEKFIDKIVDGGEEVSKVEIVGMDKSAFKGAPNSLNKILCFAEKPANIPTFSASDLTKISKSQIREKAWKNYSSF